MAARDLLGNQRVGGFAVRNAEQRLRDAHQDDAFLAGQPVLAHERIDAGMLVAISPGGEH